MLTLDPNPPLMDEIAVRRVRDGQEVTEPLWVEFHPAYGPIPAVIVIASGWDGREWADRNRYEVGSVAREGSVIRVRLDRDERRLTETPPGGDRTPFYEVSVAGDGGWCTCRGYCLSNEPGRACKHVCCVSYVIAAGLLESEVGDGDEQRGGEGGPEGTG